MPPVSKKSSKTTRKHHKKKKTTGKYKGYSKPASKSRGATNMISLLTLTPKTLDLTIPYKTSFRISQMATSSTQLFCNSFDIAMNNPIQANIVAKLALGSGGVPGTYLETNPNGNLRTDLLPYFSEYSKCVVIKSQAIASWVQTPNQEKLAPWYSNETATSPQSNYLAVNDPELDGLNYLACTTSNNQTHSAGGPFELSGNIYTMKNKVPGMSMNRVMCRPDTARSSKFKRTYSPKRTFGVKDISDTKDEFEFNPQSDDTAPLWDEPQKKAFMHTGVARIHKNSSTDALRPPNYIVEFQVVYFLTFYNRRNEANAGNAPVGTGHDGAEL